MSSKNFSPNLSSEEREQVNSQPRIVTIQCKGPDGKVWREKVEVYKPNPDPKYAVADDGGPVWAAKSALKQKVMKYYMSTLECIEEE